MPHIWIVHRTLESLERLPPDTRPAPQPDRSIVVEPMAEFMQFTGVAVGMPTIRFDGAREWLADGSRLLQSLRLSGHEKDVACIWRAEGREAPVGGEPFTAKRAEATGSRARVIAFERQLEPAQ